jgi:hypothetical protein
MIYLAKLENKMFTYKWGLASFTITRLEGILFCTPFVKIKQKF